MDVVKKYNLTSEGTRDYVNDMIKPAQKQKMVSRMDIPFLTKIIHNADVAEHVFDMQDITRWLNKSRLSGYNIKAQEIIKDTLTKMISAGNKFLQKEENHVEDAEIKS